LGLQGNVTMIKMKDMIPLAKKYPKPYEEVLATDGEHWVVVYRHKSCDVYSPDLWEMDWSIANISGAGFYEFNLNDLTHWMPLPKRRKKK
jgi:hypothetical protein